MPKELPSSSTILAGLALGFLGLLAGFMVFQKVPTENHDFIVFILGALAGAITVGAPKVTAVPAPPPTPEKGTTDA